MILSQRFHTKSLLLTAALVAGCWMATLPVTAQQQQRQNTGQARAGGSSASSSTRQYVPNGTVGDATITSDPETHRIIVITDEETSQHISQVVTNLDRPQPQVLIKVVFLEVTHNNSLDFGVEGGVKKQINGTTTGSAANFFGASGLGSVATNIQLNSFGQPTSGFAPTPPGAGLYQALGKDYEVTVRAIATADKTEVLSRPSILTRNSQPATITVGQSVPLVTGVTYNSLGNPINSITYRNVGIILSVTPFITQDGLVQMIVSPQISQLSSTSVPLSAGVSAPVIDVRSADTVVVTPDSQTVVIGGLMQTSKIVNDSKIPVLGDIPLLGALFKRKIKSTAKTELIIFLTPHIVYQPAQLAGLTAAERHDSLLTPKAFSEKELDRYLDTLPVKDPSAVADPSGVQSGSKSKK